MRAFILTIFILQLLSIGVKIMTIPKIPQGDGATLFNECFAVVFTAGMATWAAFLLFGG